MATPLAGLLGVKERVRLRAAPNAVLERFYAATSRQPKQVRGDPGGGRGGGRTERGGRGAPRRLNPLCPPPPQADVEMLSRQSGCSVRQVERWFRRRRNQDRPSLLKKFREAR